VHGAVDFVVADRIDGIERDAALVASEIELEDGKKSALRSTRPL